MISKNLLEVKKLHDLGFAVHLLYPKSKRPIEMKWGTGARKSWKELVASYRPGMNLGVRLGTPSKIVGYFLAVVDCDVKGTDAKYKDEMGAKLKTLFSADLLSQAARVSSGRGNGSAHLYVVTPEPVRAQRLAQSAEKVLVYMPSSDPSKKEIETLTPAQLKKGLRLRPAWEISLMGEGQQVVLPPSIHPDSGKPYTWKVPIESGLPRFKIEQKENEFTGETVSGNFKAVQVDLVGSSLPSKTVDAILSGDGVSDRSGALLGVCTRMLKSGFTDSEILSVLTDAGTFLGGAAFEHAQTRDRGRAAEWVRKYTLEKAKRETSAESIFADEVVETVISAEEADRQEEDLAPEKDWREQIERGSPESGSRPKNSLKNVVLILQGEAGSAVFKRDEFANADIYGCDAPWGSKKNAEIADLDTVRIKKWLADHYRFEPSDDRINQAVAAIADRNRFHPVRRYLDDLSWDGTPRIDHWLRDYLGARAPEPYLSAVSRKTLVAMIKRIYEPGCKFDQVLILEGVQGVGKSTALKNLASDWFTDAHIDVRDKDAILAMRSIWLVELGELSGMRSADVDQLKEFISRTTDRIRVPYGKRSENFPRQCIFIGTTNRDEYLKDPTGNRRFWPVSVGECDFEKVKRDRDQLLAEARFAWELGEPIYLEDREMTKGAIEEQAARTVSDSWEEIISDWLDKPDDSEDGGQRIDRNEFSILDLFQDFGPLASWKPNQPEMKRAGEALRKLGFRKHVTKVGRQSKRIWRK